MSLSARTLQLCIFIMMLTASVTRADEQTRRPAVVASLKPVELLVRAVAGEQVEVSTLVPPGASPHTYQLRPSERRQLEQAALVFWIGPDMETFLNRLLTGPDFRGRTVTLTPRDSDGGHSTEPHSHSHHHHDEGEDPHLWLDPALAVAMATTVAEHIKGIEGVNGGQIDRNLVRFSSAVAQAEEDIRQKLEPTRTLDLFTYHSAFSRFAEHYGLNIAGVLTLSPERTPGARHLAEVQERLQQAPQPCLLTEPQFNRQWWHALMDGVEVPVSTWDALATDIESTPQGYVAFQHSLADAVSDCLPEHAQYLPEQAQ